MAMSGYIITVPDGADPSTKQGLSPERVMDNPTLLEVYDSIADHNRSRERRVLKTLATLFEQRLYEQQGRERLSQEPPSPDTWVLAVATELGLNLSIMSKDRMPSTLAASAFNADSPYVHTQDANGFTAEEGDLLKTMGYQGGEVLITSVATSEGNTRVYMAFHKKADDKRSLEVEPLQVLSQMYGNLRRLWDYRTGQFDLLHRSRTQLSRSIAALRDRVIALEHKLKDSKTAIEQGLVGLDETNESISKLVQQLSSLETLTAKQRMHKSAVDPAKGSKSKRHRPRKLERDAFKARAEATRIKDSLRETRERINAILNPKRSSRVAVGIIAGGGGGFVGGTL